MAAQKRDNLLLEHFRCRFYQENFPPMHALSTMHIHMPYECISDVLLCVHATISFYSSAALFFSPIVAQMLMPPIWTSVHSDLFSSLLFIYSYRMIIIWQLYWHSATE